MSQDLSNNIYHQFQIQMLHDYASTLDEYIESHPEVKNKQVQQLSNSIKSITRTLDLSTVLAAMIIFVVAVNINSPRDNLLVVLDNYEFNTGLGISFIFTLIFAIKSVLEPSYGSFGDLMKQALESHDIEALDIIEHKTISPTRYIALLIAKLKGTDEAEEFNNLIRTLVEH
jgi:hypothetical protein